MRRKFDEILIKVCLKFDKNMMIFHQLTKTSKFFIHKEYNEGVKSTCTKNI